MLASAVCVPETTNDTKDRDVDLEASRRPRTMKLLVTSIDSPQRLVGGGWLRRCRWAQSASAQPLAGAHSERSQKSCVSLFARDRPGALGGGLGAVT